MQIKPIQTAIHVEGLKVEAYVGLHAPERDSLQVVLIDITCTLADAVVYGDTIDRTFDYVPIVEALRRLATGGKRTLIETLAEEIATECFNNPLAQTVLVSVRKPNKLPAVSAVGIIRSFERG